MEQIISRSVIRRIAAQKGEPMASFSTQEAAMEHWVLENARCKHCGKVAYESREDAEYAAKSMLPAQGAYECPYGSGWHLSTIRKDEHTMGKHIPNWKLIDCPKCGSKKSYNCTVEKINQLCCPERAAAAGLGRKNFQLPRTIMRLGSNPTNVCRRYQHTSCKGRHQGNHGLPGLPCTCSCHRIRGGSE
jgi:hypothetical protein